MFVTRFPAICLTLVFLSCCPSSLPGQQPTVLGDAVIRGPFEGSEIVVRTTSRVAGAIDSVTWKGKEFIDSFDHGRQMQSAANFDLGGRFYPETFNPTEAGSVNDGRGPTSTSRLLHLVATNNQLQTTTRMAFWLAPGQTSGGHAAKNQSVLSDHLLTKRVRIGWEDIPNVIVYDATFSVPIGEAHTYAQFEAVTGYMPAEFEKFWQFDPQSGKLRPLSDGPGEQPHPVVLATADDAYAMGVFSPEQPSPGYEQAGYGRFRFAAQQVVKWNCVFRYRDASGVRPGEYSFRMYVVLGTKATVEQTLNRLHQRFADRRSTKSSVGSSP